ncbi:MAG: hypothetical protein ACHP7C_08705 [Lysobacterales bacterium]
MSIRHVALASLVAATALASGCVVEEPVHRQRPVVVERPVVQREYVEVVAPRPPPPPIVEQVELRPGYIWARSYWRWDGRNYVVERGHWEPERRGYRYSHPHWEQRGDGWHWRAGVWVSG